MAAALSLATLGADGEVKESWIFRFALHGRERQMGLGLA